MERPLAEATMAELGAGAEANLAALFRAMARLPGAAIDESGPVARHLSFPTNPMFKGAWATDIADGDEERAIDAPIEWFRSRDAPFFFWWTGPATRPDDLGARLEKRGLLSLEGQQKVLAHGIKQTEAGAPIMAADLAALNETVLDRTPSGLVIEEVADETGLADFKRVFVATYEIPDWAGQAWVDATTAFGIGRSRLRQRLCRGDVAEGARQRHRRGDYLETAVDRARRRLSPRRPLLDRDGRQGLRADRLSRLRRSPQPLPVAVPVTR